MSPLALMAANGQPSPFLQFLPLIAIALIFYFIVFLPNKRKQNALKTCWTT